MLRHLFAALALATSLLAAESAPVAPTAPAGRVVATTYESPHSATLPRRGLNVYLPANYTADGPALPVLYLLHGAGGRAHSWVKDGNIAEIMDRGIAEGRFRPAIVVMPHGDYIIPPSKENTGENAELMIKDFVEVLMPLIERDYRVSTARADTALAGLSKGARQAGYLALRLPGRFGAIGCFSIGRYPPLDSAGEEGRLARELESSGLRFSPLLIGWGVNEPAYQTTGREYAALVSFLDPILHESPAGGHEWVVWRDLLEKHFLPAWLALPSPTP